MIKIEELDTNYCEIPVGNVESGLVEFLARWDLEVSSIQQGRLIVSADWGNGEGADTFAVSLA